jgi:hypothetical protein
VTLNQNYRSAREAGFPVEEARRRAHWADPLADDQGGQVFNRTQKIVTVIELSDETSRLCRH